MTRTGGGGRETGAGFDRPRLPLDVFPINQLDPYDIMEQLYNHIDGGEWISLESQRLSRSHTELQFHENI